MANSIIFGIISLLIVVSLFLSNFYYQKARDRERMFLLEQGCGMEELLDFQKRSKVRFSFPWIKVGVISVFLSVAFTAVGFLVLFLEGDEELFKGFLISAILGFFLGTSFIANHLISNKNQINDG